MHHFFHSSTVTDLAVMREQAQARLKPNSKHGTQTESVIHQHKADQPCVGHKHDFYALRDDLPKRFWEAVSETEEMENVR